MTITLIYDETIGDPLANILKQSPTNGIKSKTLTSFFKDEGIFFDTKKLSLNISNFNSKDKIIDRLIEISPKTIADITGSNENLIQRGQVFYAYQSVLKKSIQLNPKAQYTETGKLLPLPTQWKIIKDNFDDIIVPIFKYGYGPEIIDYSDLINPIFKSPFDLYSWKPNKRNESHVWDEFIVSRPNGNPFISYKICDDIIVESLENFKINNEIKLKLESFTKQIFFLFEASIGEILWFIDDDSICFATFSLYLYGAQKTSSFKDQTEKLFDHLKK